MAWHGDGRRQDIDVALYGLLENTSLNMYSLACLCIWFVAHKLKCDAVIVFTMPSSIYSVSKFKDTNFCLI